MSAVRKVRAWWELRGLLRARRKDINSEPFPEMPELQALIEAVGR